MVAMMMIANRLRSVFVPARKIFKKLLTNYYESVILNVLKGVEIMNFLNIIAFALITLGIFGGILIRSLIVCAIIGLCILMITMNFLPKDKDFY